MRIFLTGSSGFIGGHILRRLSQQGHDIICLVRSSRAAHLSAMALPGVTLLEGEFTQPETWKQELEGCDVVVNAVGIIRETKNASFALVHEQAPIAMFEAAKELGVRKIIQISALGADHGAQSQYHLTKRAADQRLMELGISYVVLRPSIVYGPGDQSMTFFRSLAALPVTLVPGDGQYRLQPIHIDDLVQAVSLAVEREDIKDLRVDAGGGRVLSYNELLDVLAAWLGKKRGILKVPIPLVLMRLVAWSTDLAGGRGPISREELDMLLRENWCDNRLFVATFGRESVAVEVGLARRPLSEEAKWHANLVHLRIPLQLSIAFIWTFTGIISLMTFPNSMELLARVGLTGTFAEVILYGTCVFEIVMGLATAIGWQIKWMGLIQLALMFGFTVILSYGMPALWKDPFGPLTKNIPLIAATLVMMALND